MATTEENEDIVYGDIGKIFSHTYLCYDLFLVKDPNFLQESRTNIPVTTQRRFDVYKDVAA